MKIDTRRRKGRIYCTPESPEEGTYLRNHCMGISRKVGAVEWSMENNLINRKQLGLNLDVPKSIVRGGEKPLDPATLSCPEGEELEPFQIEDVRKLSQLRGSLNANKMGAGKTIETIAQCRCLRAKLVLVLCPKTARHQWAKQVKKWMPEAADNVYVSPTKFPKLGDGCTVIVTNYSKMLNNSTLERYRTVLWDVLVVDECHRIKNPTSKTTVAIKSLPSLNRIGLTGTPIMRNPEDLWSIGHFLNPDYFGTSFNIFTRMFCHFEETFWGDKNMGLTKNKERADMLRQVLDVFMVRQAGNTFGVNCHENVVSLKMYPDQARLYSEVQQLAVKALQARDITIANGMGQVTKLQQTTTVPQLFDIKHNPKFEWILDLLEDNPDMKILVFSRFRKAIEHLNVYLEEKKITVATIHGEVEDEERESSKQKFCNDPKCRVMSGTYGALGESVDQLQTVCNVVVMLDRMWNPEDNNQAIGRLYRRGQKKDVQVYVLECLGTIDEKIGSVNLRKMQDIRSILDYGRK